MQRQLLPLFFGISLITGSQAATIIALEDFETPGTLGVWTNTAGSTPYYNFAETDQPSGKLTHNFASGGEGAVDLRKSGGTITSPVMTLDTYGSPDLTISLDFQIHNGSSTRRTFWELSLDGGSNWFNMGLTQAGGGISNDLAGYSRSVTIVEGVAGGTFGGAGGTNGIGGSTGSISYDGSAFTDNVLVRFRNGGSAGADYRQFYDNIEITSTVGIPEPSAALLGGLGALMLLRRRR